MKKKSEKRTKDELRSEYDPDVIRRSVRGKYAVRYRMGTNLVLLDPDVAKAFPNGRAVNAALRLLITVAGKSVTAN
jgi:hypothetical protein